MNTNPDESGTRFTGCGRDAASAPLEYYGTTSGSSKNYTRTKMEPLGIRLICPSMQIKLFQDQGWNRNQNHQISDSNYIDYT